MLHDQLLPTQTCFIDELIYDKYPFSASLTCIIELHPQQQANVYSQSTVHVIMVKNEKKVTSQLISVRDQYKHE